MAVVRCLGGLDLCARSRYLGGRTRSSSIQQERFLGYAQDDSKGASTQKKTDCSCGERVASIVVIREGVGCSGRVGGGYIRQLETLGRTRVNPPLPRCFLECRPIAQFPANRNESEPHPYKSPDCTAFPGSDHVRLQLPTADILGAHRQA